MRFVAKPWRVPRAFDGDGYACTGSIAFTNNKPRSDASRRHSERISFNAQDSRGSAPRRTVIAAASAACPAQRRTGTTTATSTISATTISTPGAAGTGSMSPTTGGSAGGGLSGRTCYFYPQPVYPYPDPYVPPVAWRRRFRRRARRPGTTATIRPATTRTWRNAARRGSRCRPAKRRRGRSSVEPPATRERGGGSTDFLFNYISRLF